MKRTTLLPALGTLLLIFNSHAAEILNLSSPDSRVRIQFSVDERAIPDIDDSRRREYL
jgi:hypothetical protein